MIQWEKSSQLSLVVQMFTNIDTIPLSFAWLLSKSKTPISYSNGEQSSAHNRLFQNLSNDDMKIVCCLSTYSKQQTIKWTMNTINHFHHMKIRNVFDDFFKNWKIDKKNVLGHQWFYQKDSLLLTEWVSNFERWVSRPSRLTSFRSTSNIVW